MNKKIVVFGGTGHYGGSIVRQLIQNEQEVRVVSRNAEKAAEKLGPDVEIIEGDVLDEQVIHRAVKDMDAIIISLSAVSPKLIRKMKAIEYNAVINILKAARENNIKRVVSLSVYKIRTDVLEKLGIAGFSSIKKEVEEKITESGLNWTILGCPPMQDLFFAFYRKGSLSVPGGGKNPIPTISARDVAAIAAQAAVRDDLGGERFRLPGPEVYSFPQVAKLISTELGRPIKHRTIPLPVIRFVSVLVKPLFPFLNYISKSLILLNNFPEDEIKEVPKAHQLLRENFNYEPYTLEQEIRDRVKDKRLQ